MKSVHAMKDKERIRKCQKLKDTKETQLNVLWDPWLDLKTENGHCGEKLVNILKICYLMKYTRRQSRPNVCYVISFHFCPFSILKVFREACCSIENNNSNNNSKISKILNSNVPILIFSFHSLYHGCQNWRKLGVDECRLCINDMYYFVIFL